MTLHTSRWSVIATARYAATQNEVASGRGTVNTDALGQRLRSARQHQGISLRELARRLDVSPSLISQIETGKAQPSVSTLYGMVSLLSLSLDQLFAAESPGPAREPEAEPPPVAPATGRPAPAVVRHAGARRALTLTSGVRWEELLTDPEADVEFVLMTYPPGSSSSEDGALLRHAGREVGIVTQGSLQVTIGFDEHVLGPGDSISFESSTPHRFHNPGTAPVHGVWLVMGRAALQREPLGFLLAEAGMATASGRE